MVVPKALLIESTRISVGSVDYLKAKISIKQNIFELHTNTLRVSTQNLNNHSAQLHSC